MDTLPAQILMVVGAYLLGSINSAIIVSKAFSLPDPRDLGSGNPGATNILRTGSKLAAAITLAGDLLKGLIPVLAVDLFTANAPLVAATGIAALLGHMYPLYYGFKGGKGVATTLGVLLGFDWLLGAIWIAFWLFTALLFRYSSLAALVATLLILVISWFWTENIWIFISLAIITLFVFWRHRSNIRNLLSGDETKIGEP
ncbi:MAG: glycerol-3-phosphate 1-O-acyltransferase PlsY [Gammaproteobacteria bacterium]|nr:glycerol-3-phosphate 1-O-acyltransferase PlsY [Gammaproteobacteria bacterium]NNC68624.1 glycerol-3-phosphate 1-O-acyltransferase PlsY [Gammaproteobacteria bacterium]